MSTIMECPRCRGEGHREEYGICRLCCPDVMAYEPELRGTLELPLTPEQAEYIYSHCCEPEVEVLVNMEGPDEAATACTDCTPERTCFECWAFGEPPTGYEGASW